MQTSLVNRYIQVTLTISNMDVLHPRVTSWSSTRQCDLNLIKTITNNLFTVTEIKYMIITIFILLVLKLTKRYYNRQ